MNATAQMEQIHRVSVNIMGERYTIKGDASPDYISEVANLVDDRMRELRSATNVTNKTRLAVLAAINIAYELIRLKSKPSDDDPDTPEQLEISERTRQLITMLDEGLIGDTLD